MRLAADDMESVVLPGCGHYPAEETPDAMLSSLTPFPAPYRELTADLPEGDRAHAYAAKKSTSARAMAPGAFSMGMWSASGMRTSVVCGISAANRSAYATFS